MVASSSNVTNYFQNKVERDSELQCAAKKATFAYVTAKHEFSFTTSE